MSTQSIPSPLFPTETDPEHILGRGFKISLSTTELAIADDEASTPHPVVVRSVWGKAVRTARDAWPYDFQPLLYSGAQIWTDRTLLVPPLLANIFPSGCFGQGSGAFVALDEVPAAYDSMEFVFSPGFPDPPLAEVYMAWVVTDSLPPGLDPFVVAATRVLEPLISELRGAVSKAEGQQVAVIGELSSQVEALSAAVRDLQKEPARLRTAIRAVLGVLSGVVLSIVPNRLDPLVDRIDWPALYNAIQEVVRQLALG